MNWSTLGLWLFGVVAARPVDTATSHEPESTSESDGESHNETESPQEVNSDDNSTDKEKEMAKNQEKSGANDDKYNQVTSNFTQNRQSNCNEFECPGPPNIHYHNLHEVDQLDRVTMISQDRFPSESNNGLEGTTRNVIRGERTPGQARENSSWGTLSEDNLSVDARALRLHGRKLKSAKTKEDKLKEVEDPKYESKDDFKQEKSEKNDKGSIEEFIKGIVGKQFEQRATIYFFDAAIVYEKEDYYDALRFKEETLMIVQSDEKREVRIELFDSEVFAQSKVCVVQDVIDKCSVIFVYLTNNFKSPELKFFIEEAIGICRLGLNNKAIQAGVIPNDRQWIIKPVHTAAPNMRAYEVPTGLLTVYGIDWFNKHTAHTKAQIRAVVHTAINKRKERELKERLSNSQLHVPVLNPSRQMAQQFVPNASQALNAHTSNTKQTNHESLISHQSNDAMSFVGESSNFQNPQFRSNQSMQNASSVGGNNYNSLQDASMSSLQAHPSNISGYWTNQGPLDSYSYQRQNYFSGHNFHQTYPEQGLNRNYQGNPALNTVQNGQMSGQPGQYITQQNHQQSFPQCHTVVQSAGLQGQNLQPGLHGPGPGYPNGQNAYFNHSNTQNATCTRPYANVPPMPLTNLAGHQGQRGYGQGYTGQQFSRETSVPGQMFSGNSQVQQNLNGVARLNMHGANLGFPLYQQNVHNQPQVRPYQDQQLSHDALHSDLGTNLQNPRNDAPLGTQLSVVSKVTGNLIVNPNLSTDDVEVDNYVSTQDSSRTTEKQNGKKKTYLSKRSDTDSSDSEDLSSDSDFEIPKSKVKHGRRKGSKVVNIVGCKIVQMGSTNKVKERPSKYSDTVVEETQAVQSKSKVVDMKQRRPKKSNGLQSKGLSLEQHKMSLSLFSEPDKLSVDNMSVDSSILRNIDTGLNYKHLADKDDIPKKVYTVSVNQVPSQQNCTMLNISSPVTNSEIQNQSATNEDQISDSSEDNFTDNDDSLFKSGAFTAENPNVARFTFSQAKPSGMSLLTGRKQYMKTHTEHIKQMQGDTELD